MSKPLASLWRKFGRLLFLCGWPAVWVMIKFSAGRTRAFIVHDNHVLLVKDWLGNGKWKLPGGGIERYETAEQCVMREVFEETTIQLQLKQLQPLATFTTNSNNIKSKITAFKVELNQRPEVSVGPIEICDYFWCPLEDIDETKLSQTTQTVLQHFRKS